MVLTVPLTGSRRFDTNPTTEREQNQGRYDDPGLGKAWAGLAHHARPWKVKSRTDDLTGRALIKTSFGSVAKY
jgi:hypothetical protein